MVGDTSSDTLRQAGLLKPVAPRLLSATVSFLWAQQRSDEIREAVRAAYSEAASTRHARTDRRRPVTADG